MKVEIELMMKCDMCYDRTSVGKRPMCATVCPSEALFFGTREEIATKRREKPVNEFRFGSQTVKTKVNMMTAPQQNKILQDIMNFLPDRETSPMERTRSGAPDAAAAAVWEEIKVSP